VTETDLENIAEKAKSALGPSVWMHDPDGVIQLTIYSANEIHEAILVYDGSRVVARLSTENDPGGEQRRMVAASVDA
jgi:hypothetical protein